MHRIERLMREQSLCARPRRRGMPKDHGEERSAIADNVLDRQFKADAPNRKWVADFTHIWTAEGWLYVVVLDLYSRRIVGWSMQSSMTSQLVGDALMMAIWRHGRPQELLHHSDQGQSKDRRGLSTGPGAVQSKAGIEQSVGSKGDSYDNALAETINCLYKAEVIQRRGPWKTKQAVELARLEWVSWFNAAAGLHPACRVRGQLPSTTRWSARDRLT